MRFSPIVLLLVAILGCGSDTNPAAERVETHEQAIAAIEELGGEVTLSPNRPVVSVNFNRTKVTDEELLHLKALASLQTLWLQNTNITDAGLVHLKALTSLRVLNLAGTKVTDSGLEYLKGLTSLRVLNLAGTNVTDSGLVHLKGLTSLQKLWLYDTNITHEGVKRLQTALPNCYIVH